MILYQSVELKVSQIQKEGLCEFHLEGEASILWPNREGELFSLSSVYPFLKERGLIERGISISWPATASIRGFLFYDPHNVGGIIDGGLDYEGSHLLLRLTSSSERDVTLSALGTVVDWEFTPFDSYHKLTNFPPFFNNQGRMKRQFQLGFIGPDGKSSIAKDQGFMAIHGVMQRLIDLDLADKGDIFHLFGYSHGHDRGYPDYSPSESLGGAGSLRRAVQKLNQEGFETSAYLNGRLVSTKNSLFTDHLKDSDGNIIVETYHGNDFYLMNPNCPSWQEHLLGEARKLKDLGFQTVQVDQIAGRAAAVPPGQVWGKGYELIINEIRSLGLNVWIQGICDFYDADRFELSFRQVNILFDGTVRGGFPLGKSEPTLFYLLRGRREIIAPLKQVDSWSGKGFKLIADCLGEGGNLPLYGESYSQEIEKLYEKLENKSLKGKK